MGGKVDHDCNLQRSIGYFLEALILLAPFTKKPIRATLRGITSDQTDPSVSWFFFWVQFIFCFIFTSPNLPDDWFIITWYHNHDNDIIAKKIAYWTEKMTIQYTLNNVVNIEQNIMFTKLERLRSIVQQVNDKIHYRYMSCCVTTHKFALVNHLPQWL